MNSRTVLVERRGPVGWIRLNRPEVLNALNADLVVELDEALTELELDKDIRVLVITGTGRAFCAGGDLGSFSGGLSDDAMNTFLRRAAGSLEHIPQVDKPVIAALNGVTAAGGLEIALACDVVVAKRSVRIGDAHVNFGLIPGAGGAVRLARVVGPMRAKYLSFTGKLFPAEQFLEWGVVSEVVDDDVFEDRVQELALEISEKSPLVLAATKRLIDDSLEQSTATALRAERQAMYAHFDSDDLKEGLTAFAEKRKPNYTGR
ncbi:enoyl-CoA hydratase/isomerase family protein [Rhodococcus sp. USK10]|uniref:enoyl-CoA hydratase/isomerase family protein n=1 Tax=Rhodococcus sp. USK10 TaxID=2789739 RepID=UPI001C5D2884|nr:enoyl-CoA hydratase/isomerase family protein [Rhodococcus sp. USK10]QYB04246.1 enoyl-CoA hydratase/isomerase family protein [Rhodococcus sp. USK10]